MKIYGLIGKSLGHSFSGKYFSEKFQKEHIRGCIYQNFELQELDREIPNLKNLPGLAGLNVTIPYKTGIVSFLDELSAECKEMKACNCIKIADGKWTGYNTDVVGFERSFLPHLEQHHDRALVLGTGGASKAVAFVLKKLEIPFLKVTRKKENAASAITYDEITKAVLDEYNIIINTTPVGMYPNVASFPSLPYQYISGRHYFYDLVYNPAKTLFLSKAEEKGAVIENGQDMLVIQAEESWRIWNSK